MLLVVGSAPLSVCWVALPIGVYAISHELAGTVSPLPVVVAAAGRVDRHLDRDHGPGTRRCGLLVERVARAYVADGPAATAAAA